MNREPSLAEVRRAQVDLQHGGWREASLRDARCLLLLGAIPDDVFQTQLRRLRASGQEPTREYIEAFALARTWERRS